MANKQVVVFQIGTEEYGIDIKNVFEIIQMQEITKIPQASKMIEGVINLRGRVIPIIDLKRKFGYQSSVIGQNSRIIITDIGEQAVGIIIDEVSEVISIDEEAIELPNVITKSIAHSGIVGIGKVDARLIIILDMAGAFTGQEKEQLRVEMEG